MRERKRERESERARERERERERESEVESKGGKRLASRKTAEASLAGMRVSSNWASLALSPLLMLLFVPAHLGWVEQKELRSAWQVPTNAEVERARALRRENR